MATETTPKVAENGAKPRVPGLMDEISSAETELVLQNFAQLKERALNGRDGEMRIAVRKDPRTGVVEITYCGISEKADLGSLRQMYSRLRTQGART